MPQGSILKAFYSYRMAMLADEPLKFADPDVPETDGLAFIAMGLQFDRTCTMCHFIVRFTDIECWSAEFEVVLYQYPIE